MIETPDRPDGATWRAWGIEPSWSRVVDVASHDGASHRWHVLDTGSPESSTNGWATIVCVHGNPTWAYAWKTLLTKFAGTHRVIAIDQLSMGYSERVGLRRYAARVDDLADLIGALDIDRSHPLVLAAHDWGGAVAMGWAVDHADELDGLVLCNTGIGVPAGRGAPKIIRLAASAPLRDLVCRRTSGFVEGTVRLSGKRITKVDRIAFRAPYRRARFRHAIADFVGDIPLSPPHPSESALSRVADLLPTIHAPVLLAWGARDIVFDDDFAADLAGRFQHAELHRFAEANHLVMAEADVAGTVETWLRSIVGSQPIERPLVDVRSTSVFDGIERRRHDTTVAVHDAATGTSVDFADFARAVDGVAATLIKHGLQPGDRVAMLTPPGVDLLTAVYGVWRAGGVTVVADRGLGLGGLGQAVKSARASFVIGPRVARAASSTLRWAPRATALDIAELMGEAAFARLDDLPAAPDGEAPAAILFTSGATGPAKGVRYLHRQLAAQRDALAMTYSISDDDRLVAAFAPFALYGPALGVPTGLVDCDVTKPGELTVDALETACLQLGATMAFASPAALANVVRTGDQSAGAHPGLEALRLVFSAGAPVPAETLRAVARLTPNASLHTPYGMTEALPVSDIDLVGIEAAEADAASSIDAGVCVGYPVSGAEVSVVRLGFDACDGVPDPIGPSAMGEILVRAPWVSEGYVGRWGTERSARPGDGWHRTGDVGRIDDAGRLWVDGRAVHVVDAVDGPVAPVPVERSIERALTAGSLVTAGRVAAVGVGPIGCQQLVIVIERTARHDGLADDVTAAAVRAAAGVQVAAVLTASTLPVDVRHNAKIDRTALACWATDVLSGESGPRGLGPLVRRLRSRRA